jgi:hypothetical protein
MVCKCYDGAYEPAEDSSSFGTITALHPGVETTTVASSLGLGERSDAATSWCLLGVLGRIDGER